MRWLALTLAFGCSTPPCPEQLPLCIEDGGTTCRAWVAGCCSGVVVCALGTTFAEDAGPCTAVAVPADKRIMCQ